MALFDWMAGAVYMASALTCGGFVVLIFRTWDRYFNPVAAVAFAGYAIFPGMNTLLAVGWSVWLVVRWRSRRRMLLQGNVRARRAGL